MSTNAPIRPSGDDFMKFRAYLYDAEATDREIGLSAEIVQNLNPKQLLWVDIADYTEQDIRNLGVLFSLTPDTISTLLEKGRRPRLDNYGSYFQLNVVTLQEVEGNFKLVELNFIIGPNYVLTVHPDTVNFLESYDSRIKGDTELGRLGAAAFLATLLDWQVTAYFRVVETVEGQVDKLDDQALRMRDDQSLFTELLKLRRRVALIRRTLSPHREVYAALARPDFHVLSHSTSAAHFTTLHDRLERAIETVENARELLVGSFEMFTTQTALRTNQVMKTLTLASFIWFPASVIVAIAAMLFRVPVNPLGTPGFWLMISSIVLIGVITVIVARKRGWI